MSTEIIYKAVVEKRENTFAIVGHACSSNVSPKPSSESVRATRGETMWELPLSEARDFIVGLCRSYDSGSVREAKNFTGPKAFLLWRGRFKKAGINIGPVPPDGEVCYYSGIEFGIPVSSSSPNVLSFKKGAVLSAEEATQLVKDHPSFRVPVIVGTSGFGIKGSLGFFNSDGLLCIYKRGCSRNGYLVEDRFSFMVDKNVSLVLPPVKGSRIVVEPIKSLSDFDIPERFVAITIDGEVFAGAKDGNSFAPGQQAFHDGCRAINGDKPAWNHSPVCILTQTEGTALLAFFAVHNPQKELRLIPASQYRDSCFCESLAA